MENQEFQIAKPYRKKEFQSVRIAENSLSVKAKHSWFEIPLGKIVLISEGDRRLVDFTARHTDHPVVIRDDKNREYKFYLGLSDRLNFVRILRTKCDSALYINDRSEYNLPKSNTAKSIATKMLSRKLVKRISLFGMILLSSVSVFLFAVSAGADMLLICFSLSFAIGSAVKVVEAIKSIRKLRTAEELD